MIPISELISVEALRRYDDDGEPVYTTRERLLLALRWFGWVSSADLSDALDIGEGVYLPMRQRYQTALQGLLADGLVMQRGERGAHEYRLAAYRQDKADTCRRCSSAPSPGHVLCPRHVEWQRSNKRIRRAA